ncbi:MAG: hypothetical protein ACRC8B_22785 [Aeromonas sobria]|uniref:hypothetical protein n=1 Tax=Aeromonas sobria TaxID=646 RepID=UPI003F3CB19A
MIIDVITDPATKFSQIGEGRAFVFEAPPESTVGGVFIKCKMVATTDYCYGARLADGMVMKFGPDAKVTPLDLKVVNA